MAKKFNKILAMLMLLCVMMNALPLQALAADGEEASPAPQSVVDVVVSIPAPAKESAPAKEATPASEPAPAPVSAPAPASEPAPAPAAEPAPASEPAPAKESAPESEVTVKVETQSGVVEDVKVNASTEVTDNGDGTSDVSIDLNGKNVKTEEGMKVNYSGEIDVTVDANGEIVGGEANGEYHSSNGKYYANGGFEAEFVEDTTGMNGTTVDIPKTDVDDPSTEEKENVNIVEGPAAGTVLEQDGDLKESETDGTYDYTQTVVEKPGSVTVETTDIEFTENVVSDDNLHHVKSETDYEAGNELFDWNFRNGYLGNANIVGTKELLDKIAADQENGTNTSGLTTEDGYAFIYIGGENTSQVLPTFLFKSPSADNPDQEPIIINGEEYYLRHYGGTEIDTFYQDGVETDIEEGGAAQIFSVPQQFLLYDPVKKQLVTTYCADFETGTVSGFSYNIENVEDATYYTEDEAEMIRAIATNGYWGTTVNEDGSNAVGSLAAMKESLLATGNFTEAELELLTDGVALTATQMAIWTYSNKLSDVEFLNAMYTKNPNANGVISTSYAGQLINGNTLAETLEAKDASFDVLYKVYEYLINLDPQKANGTDAEKTTADTIINKENFIRDMNVTIVEKVEDHDNNKDDDKDNDAYLGTLTFALEVTPVGNDKFEVTVLGPDGSVHTGYIVSKDKEDETTLKSDDNGNYSFPEITIIEGNQAFNITLEGVQNLKEGVYLYSSEVRDDNESSQTLVGLAGGEHQVDVSMTIEFDVNVDDQVVAKERVWRKEVKKSTKRDVPPGPGPGGDGPDPLSVIPEEEVPLADGLEVILDEEVPLAAAPETGDGSILWLMMSLMSAFGLCLLALSKKKCHA